MARIHNTLHWEQLWLSESALPDLAGWTEVAGGEPAELRFSEDGTLLDLQ